MSVLAIIGAQWGDEGKGKIVDELSMRADFVVRYQGGSNAGHRVVHEKAVPWGQSTRPASLAMAW